MHRTLPVALALALSAALAGCDDPAKDAPKATVTDAPKPTAAATAKPTTPAATATAAASAAPAATGASAAAGPKESLAIAADGSSVGFVGSKVTGKHEGSFEKFSGTIDLVDGAIEKSKVTISIDTESVKTDMEKLTGHLKSGDFFDTAKFPKATFESTEIKAAGTGFTVSGNLDLHGVKKAVSFPATITVAPDAVTAKAEFAINRKDFGIVYAGKADDLIRDDVLIKLSVKAPRAKK
jgi:polyisoprenoid-binding protein YceI